MGGEINTDLALTNANNFLLQPNYMQNPIKEDVCNSIMSTIKKAKDAEAEKQEEFDAAQKAYYQSCSQLDEIEFQLGYAQNANNQDLLNQQTSLKKQKSSNWINFDVALSSLQSRQSFLGKVSVFESFLNG